MTTYVFYADVYFVQNFIMKAAVLYLSLYCNKLHFAISTWKGITKILLASFLGTVVEISALLYGSTYAIYIAVVHLLEIPLMMFYVLGKQRRKMLWVIVTGYFFTMVINGVLEFLWNMFGEHGGYVFFLLIACGAVCAGVRLWQNYKRNEKGIFQIELVCAEKSMFTYGFYDSGNKLKDPYTGKGVHIISRRLLDKLAISQETKVCVPYQALGNAQGILDVYYIDSMKIYGTSDIIEQQKIPVGVAEEKLFEGKKYEVILNENVW